ncbi:MAG: hypothetical protein E6G60_12100 [Actinobacteria bacterium]|nr:MAG: hypothetical protein E6G60_12100 [Actinomycetota bacterium]
MAIDFMVGELRNLGFNRITELPHGQRTRLTGDFEIASFQYGFDDSALVITDGRTVIVNLNDCKIRGRPLHQIITNFEHPTFLLKNYSWAQSYPICYRAENPADLELLSRDSYIQDFLQTVRETEPKYAIPFASMVCLLHPETRHLNKELITSPEVAEAFARSGITTTELVTFNPGDSWDDKSGFTRSHDDYYRDRDVRISQLEADVAPAIERSLAEEAARELTFEAFANYFGDFLRALPPGIGWLLRRPVVFEGPNAAQPYWILDFRRRTVWRSATLPPRSPRDAPTSSASPRGCSPTPSRSASPTTSTSRCVSRSTCAPRATRKTSFSGDSLPSGSSATCRCGAPSACGHCASCGGAGPNSGRPSTRSCSGAGHSSRA